MDTETETGAEAGGESYFAQLEAEQNAAEQTETTTEPAPEAEAAPPAAESPPEAEKLEPLTPEEYQRRHENINAALKEERAEKRAIKSELAQLREQLQQLQTSQPQQFQQFTIDQQIADYATVDWNTWAATDPVAANNAALQYQALIDQREAITRQAQQAEQQRTAQQQQQAMQAFAQALSEQEAEYRQVKPDYEAAMAHLRGSLQREAEGMGYFGQDADAYVRQSLIETGMRVHAAGRNLAEFAYSMAQNRGYTPPAPDLASVQAGAQAAKSISTLGPKSSGTEGGSFEENMANLSGAAARSFWEKAKQAQYR